MKEIFNGLKKVDPEFADCIEEAETEAEENPKTQDSKTRTAVALVNLYTQECPNDYFYSRLNRQLRSLQPAPLWQNAATALSEAFDTLGESNFHKVFSGKDRFDEFQNLRVGRLFKFNQFSSTSKFVTKGLEFACGIYFFEIREVKGFDCVEYSAFPEEEEVIIKPTAEFLVRFNSFTNVNNCIKSRLKQS